ncbi:MAG: glycosyltransferase family 4 protein [Saccharofermentans sp.]|nr:glycosyltransferase family 4 protein [Saccharofermentans sp.]
MIAFNVQPLAQKNLTGIGFYAASTLRELVSSSSDFEMHVFDFLGRNEAHVNVENNLGLPYDKNRLHVVKNMPLGAYIRLGKGGRICPYEKLTSSSADMTVFFNYLVPQGLKGKSVITIYDMVCMRYPETMDDRNRRLLQKHLKPSALKADAIVTISEFSKSEIKELLGIPDERIFVAPCGTDTSYYQPFTSEEEELGARKRISEKYSADKYLLYVGTLEPRKNIKTIVKAFEKASADLPDVKLVLAGGVGWHSEETLAAINDSPVKDRIVQTGYITQEEKRDLYRCAQAFVYPSIYEGFGMPVTEAMACGTYPIISNTSSLPEVTGDLALKVDAMDADAFAEAFIKVCSSEPDEAIREQLIARASSYSWQDAANTYKQAFSFVSRETL